ncbi:glutathione S-transferase family protein [Litorivita pollutaquae]|uniref:Glutathione S-transferase family protein n=1 Tax=Litorivita pollutaquae TaxID=2200892 RepID=A0A2V4MV87_9RHOB|nr:glutathione S-transferase family protein [Litorivita pollutaquae]PYC46324.1 glutathione S-transferase family protein [Litorivita pollutaquae]
MEKLKLVSHHLCPYVQRAAIALSEKGVPFDREWIDLADRPEWFKSASPLGKVPLLMISDDQVSEPTALFESAVIVEFLEDTEPNPLHPSDPVERARHRAWIEFASSVLNGIGRLYNAPSNDVLDVETEKLRGMFTRLENDLEARSGSSELTYFAGDRFSLVDAAFGPVFRYLDTFEKDADLHLLNDSHKRVLPWRNALAARPSVKDAIDERYPDRLRQFLVQKGTAISTRIE